MTQLPAGVEAGSAPSGAPVWVPQTTACHRLPEHMPPGAATKTQINDVTFRGFLPKNALLLVVPSCYDKSWY